MTGRLRNFLGSAAIAAALIAGQAQAQSYSDPSPINTTKPVIIVDQTGTPAGRSGNGFHVIIDGGVLTGGTAGAVTIVDGGDVTKGGEADAACGTDTGTCTQIALLKRQMQRLTTLITNLGSPFQAGGNIGNAYAQASTTSGQSGFLVMCATATSAPSNTNGQTNPLSCDPNGFVRVTAPASAPLNVTVNTPPNDVTTGPTNVTGATDVSVSSQGAGSATLQVTGTFTGLSGLVQASDDNANWTNIGFYVSNGGAIVTSGTALTSTGFWAIPVGGYKYLRFHVTALSTGTAVVTLNASAGALDPPNSVASGGKSVTATNLPATVDTNDGAASANTVRFVEASNASANANKGQGATGAAVPSGALYMGANSSGNLTGIIQGDTTAAISVASTTGTLITHSSTKLTYITHWDIVVGAAETVTLEYGTGSTCGTGTTTIGSWAFAANAGISAGAGLGPVIVVPSGKDVCLISSGATAAGLVTYTQF